MKHSAIWLLPAMLQIVELAGCTNDNVAPGPTEPALSARHAIATAESRGFSTNGGRGFSVVDVPSGSTFETALDINDRGVIVGRYLASDGKTTYGYVRSESGAFVTIQYPDAVFTVAAGINDVGDIVGQYSLPSDIVPGKPAVRHGFLLRNEVYTSFDPPGSVRTNALGINNAGDIVGRYSTATKSTNSGFVLRHGSFNTIDYPGAVETDLWAINGNGEILGAYGAPGGNHIFVLRDGNFSIIELPVANVPTDKGDINDRGDIAGFFCDAAPPTPCTSGTGAPGVHAFFYGHGAFSQFDVPDAKQTVLFGINARGTLVGGYQGADNVYHGVRLDYGAARAEATPASITWNAIARDYVGGLTTKPSQQATLRVFAYLSLAQYKAVIAARRGVGSADDAEDDDGRGADSPAAVEGAVAGASTAVLSYFFAADAAKFDVDASALAHSANTHDPRFAMGQAVGREIGALVVELAKTDRFDAAGTGARLTGPCNWTGTNPQLPLLGQMRTFFIASGSQFRPPAPPSCDSPEFAAALAEIRRLSDSRSPQQLAIAQYWAGTTGALVAGLWNAKISDLLIKHRLRERDAAHALAITNMTAMDALIACHDGKYAYWLIRPFQADPAITTPIGQPNHPSYPSNHACVSGAVAYVLGALLPSEREQLAAQADQAGESRLYAGIHYRFDKDAGLEIARQVSAVAIAKDAEQSAAFSLGADRR